VVWHFNAAEASKYTQKENAYQIVTLSTDGRVLIWNWRNLDAPVYAYELVHKRPDPKNPKQVSTRLPAVALWPLDGAHTSSPRAYSDEKVANRDISIWHLVIKNGY
jgi:hypothetical protein